MPAANFNSPKPSTSAQAVLRDLSALIDDLDADDDWLNEINIEDVLNKSMIPISQLDKNEEDFDNNSGDCWIFPMNYEKREYQLNISRSCLFTNVLVCLPTGLGKTFIAAVVIYNFYRWFPRSKIIFMAPSRPLVNQQIDACYKVIGIPPDETAELTGRSTKEKRMILWNSKRVFFATPQVIQNDISDPSFPVDAIKLVVVDEAHKAKGKFAYCEVIKKIHAANPKFRVLALSATPGKQDDVIEIIKNLLISKVEVRTENSIDVRQYTFSKTIDVIKVPLGSDLTKIRDGYINIVDPYLRRLIELKVISSNNRSKGWIIMQQQKFLQESHPQKAEVTKLFSIVVSLLYSLDLLERHGIQIFLKSFIDDENVTKMKYYVAQDRDLKEFLKELNEKYKYSNPLSLNVHALPNGEIPSIADKNLFYGHPKFGILKRKLTEYFDNGGAKVIIFCEFRDTVTLVFTQLLELRPVVLPRMLIGQGGAVSQKDQLTIMKDFRTNKVNVLVTTSVCEEGIDVGEVDLVICFDINSKNPTRFVQRIGRTGRKRKGKVIILASEGKEMQVVGDVVGSKEKLNKSIHSNKEISKNLYKNSPRLVPISFLSKCVETKFNIPEVQTETKAKTRAKKNTVGKVAKPSTTITSHFKSTEKSAQTKTGSIDLIGVPDIPIVSQEIAAPSVPVHKNDLEIINEFNEELKKIMSEIVQNKALVEHIKWSGVKDLKMVENMSKVFQSTLKSDDSKIADSVEHELNCVFILETESSFEKSFQDTSKIIEEKIPKPTPKVEKYFDSQECQFIEVESRYANQFAFGGGVTPLKSSFFQPLNKIFNSTIKSTPLLAASPGHKKMSTKKKSPIQNSPLIRAFERQRTSCSTPVTTRAKGFQQSPMPILKPLGTPSTSVSLNKSKESIDVCEYFGINSIDDIFDGFDTSSDEEAEERNKSHAMAPASCESSIAQVLERDNDMFLNVEFDDEVVESSLVGETLSPSKSSKEMIETKCEEKFDFKIDEIFAISDDSSVELEKNIADIPSDLSQMTQEYELDNEVDNKKEDETQMVDTVTSPVSSRAIQSPKQKTLKRPEDSVAIITDSEASPFALPIRREIGRKRKRNYFLDSQAAVDDLDSSDDDDEDFPNSFIDNTIDLSIAEDSHIDMHLKYIQSLRSPSARQNGNFKIPFKAPLANVNVFSQVPCDQDDWEVGSFIVENEGDETIETEPDELEIAEMKLKQKRKRGHQKKNGIKRRKIVQVHESSDDEELQEFRNQLQSNPD